MIYGCNASRYSMETLWHVGRRRQKPWGEFMNLLLIVGVLLLSTVPVGAGSTTEHGQVEGGCAKGRERYPRR
jgi:hypothetical protein